MPKIFLSYCKSQRAWLEAFRRTELLENELCAQGADDIFDYEVYPITQGQYRVAIDEALKETNVFLAVIDNEYPKRKETLREFHMAREQFFRNGSPVPGKAFALIFIDQNGLDWFQQTKNAGRHHFPEDTGYRKMFDYHGPRYPYTESDRPNGTVIEALRKFLKDVRDTINKDRFTLQEERRIPIVILGHIANTAPPAIAGACGTLKRLMEIQGTLPVETFSDGWVGTGQPQLRDLAARGAIFVLPVDQTAAQLVAAHPTMLLDQLQYSVELCGDGIRPSLFDRCIAVYWMPAGVESAPFRQRSQNICAVPGPYFRTGPAEEIAEWLACKLLRGHPPPPIHYESAPLDDAMQQLTSQLKEALNGIFRPPEPNVLSFIPNERPLSDELSEIAKARGGIFITHLLATEANSHDLPSDLKHKILQYAEELGQFCLLNGLRTEQIYRVALVRRRNDFWKGRWSADIGRDDARLRGWRFLGIRKSESGSFEMDQGRIAQCVAEIKTLFEPM